MDNDPTFETDYLVIGAGAMGMAFADTILDESDDLEIALVDRYHQPGGHWNVAYPFVTLHQPSAFYGVGSTELGSGRKDRVGLNRDLFELASGAEILAYFDQVMRHRFLPSGRVRYFPMHDVVEAGDGLARFENRLTGAVTTATVRRRLVDATHLKTTVPATHAPNFEVAAGVRLMPPNDLPSITEAPDGFVVLGGGKTAIDACLWLLQNGVAPAAIRWIVPRDSWFVDRSNTQPSMEFFETTVATLAAQMEAIAESDSVEDLFHRLEQAGVLLRLDPDVEPTMYHAATISRQELGELRRIDQVVRRGRVQRIGPEEITLDEGTMPTTPGTVHVDCTASAVGNLEPVPVFQPDRIVPQTIRSIQPVFSAALIAHIELHYDSDDEKNRLAQVVPIPNHATDWIPMNAAAMTNQYFWSQEPNIKEWLLDHRLDGFSRLLREAPKDDEAKQDILRRLRENTPVAVAKLHQYTHELRQAPSATQSTPAQHTPAQPTRAPSTETPE